MIETSQSARLPPASRWRRVVSLVAAQLRGGVPAADPVLEALEPRLLLSAELGPGLDLPADVPFSGAGGTALDGYGEPALPAQPAALDLDALAALGGDGSVDMPSARREIVFVDAGVEDYEALLDDLRRERDGVALEVVVLDSERDGVAQMDAALGAARDVDAVHVIAHGARGGMQLGATWLDGAALDAHAATIAGWQDVFTRDADLLIYGCDLAAGPEGRAFVAALASLTGADVAASDDLTGAAARGGDWTLEHASGAVETTLALSAHAQAGFTGVLAQITVNTTSDGISLFANTSSIANLIASPGLDGKISLREALAAANNDNGADTIFLQDANYRLTSVLDGDLDITDDVAIVGVAAGQTTIDGLGLARVLDVSNDDITVSIANLTIANGLAGVLEGEDGGGLRVQGGGNTPVVTLDNVWFRDNATSGSNGSGGALYVGAGSVTVTNALFEDNTSRVGGGIHNDGATVTLTNVTLSNNTATNAEGGGLRNDGIATLNHVTAALNDANTQGGGVFNAGTLHLTNSILADNTAGGTGPDLFGALATSGSNVFGEDNGGSGYAGSDHRDVDPLLVALADNGGLLPTHDLQGGSVAIDDAGTGSSPALDQRGFVRDGNPDIGAHEASASAFTQVLFLDGRGDGGDLPVGALKIAPPDDPTLDNFDPGRDGDDGLLIQKGGSGAGENDPVKHQLWLSAVPGLSLDGPVTLDIWTAMKGFDLDKGATVHAFLVATNAGGAALSTLASATVTRADWDVADTGTWIADTFAFGNVTVDLAGDRFLGVKLVVDSTSDDNLWFAYDATAYPARLNLAAGALNAPTASAAAGSPYVIAEGSTLALDGSASFDLDGSIVSWEWDVLGDGSFEKTGQTASYTWGDLVAAGLVDDGTYDVALRVTDDDALQHSATFSVTVTNAAPQPGGIVAGPTLWLKADAGITTGTGGVSQWDNQVANASLPDVRQGTAGERPDLVSDGLNFNPVVAFDGTDDELRDAAVLGSDLLAAGAGSIFTVVRIDSAEPIVQWEENTDNRVNLEGPAPRFDYGDDVAPYRLEGSGMSSGYHIVNAQAVPGASVNLQIFVDGTLDAQNDTGAASPLDPTATGQFVLGAWAGGGLNADMELAEVIVYDSDLSAADRTRVESYLAVKYGITLAQATPTNYVDSGGTVIWDATANAGYANDIAGIGRDDPSGLDQPQSRSISADAILTMAGAVAPDDGEFLLWGNDDGALTESGAGNPAGVDQRLERVWRIAETGELGTVTLAFDVGALGVTGTAASDFHLIMDSDTDFSSGATLVAASGFAGGIVTFTGVDLEDGGFLALGTYTNLAPVADAGVTPAIAEGGTLMLDGSASSDPDGVIVGYEWDVGDDGSFEKSGVNASYTWADLLAAGVSDDGSHDVALRVTDDDGAQHTQTFSVTVTNTAPTLAATGDASVGAGVSYTLDLAATDPGDDTITGWSINWGDGTVDSVGDVNSVSHVYANTGFTHAITVSATDEDGTFFNTDLVVAAEGSDNVIRFDAADGSPVLTFADGGELSKHGYAVTGPDGLLYVGGESDNVVRYDPATGALVSEFVPNTAGIDRAKGLAFGPDGHLYVASRNSDEILRFDGATGAFLGVFASGLNDPQGIAFGPDGHLYVANEGDHSVLRFDGTTGAALGVFVTADLGGLDNPMGIAFANGSLYVASSGSDEVLKYSATTGAFEGVFVSLGLGGLDWPTGLAFGPQGDLYVSSRQTDAVMRFDGITGAYLGDYVASAAGGLDQPMGLSFLPTLQVTVTAANPPVFVADGPFTLDEHSAFGTVVGDVDANDGDGADPGPGDLIITEIMYDPASTEADWEWIEIYNGGSETVDLAGFVLDDGNVNAHGAANIAAGSIAAGGTAVLYNADAVTAGDFTAAWGAGLNLVAVTGWSELPLNNDGDRIGLWSSFADYAGDHQVHANALVSLVYDDLGPWPAPDDAGSIFLTDLAADPADGANWALSTLGAPSPHGGTAAQSAAAGGNAGSDVATPGDAVPGGGVTYTITANVNGDADGNLAFAIGATTGVITVNDPDDLDFESGTPLVIGVEADDGFAQTTTNVTIHLNDVNDLPGGSGVLTTTALDDDATDVKIFTGLTVTDPDAGESDLTLRITLSDPAAGTAGGGFVALGGGVYERTGLTVAQANMALQVAQFTPAADTGDSGTFTTDISVAVDDQGGGGFQTVLAPTTMTITRVNDGPTATNLSQTKPYVESGPAVDFDDIVVSDADAGDTVTATLTLTDTAAGALSVSGGASYTAGTGVWTITDTVANVNAALANVAFVPAPGYNADTTVLINIADGGEDGAAAATGSISLDGSSINDQLAATNTSQAKAYTEGAASVALDDIFVTDPDAGDVVTATLTLADAGAGSLTVSGGATYTAGTGVWAITNTVANVNAALANVAFAPGTDNDLDTSIAVHIADGGEDGTVPVTGTITLDVTPVNDQLGATNTNQVQGYTEDAPSVALDDIVVTDVDTGETVSATLTLADPGAGSLSVSGAATYSPGTGVWTITDTVTNVNAALANVAFAPAAHYDAATSIAVSLVDGGEDGTVAVTGTIALNATPVGDTPQAANASTLKDVQSAPIALDRHAADGPEVTHFRISAITNGTLTLADGVSAVLDGQFVTVADGQAGLRFTPLPGSTLTGSFAVEASEDGVGVAAQSGQAIATVTVLDPGTPAPTPTPTPPPTTTPEPPDDAEEEAALASDFASAEALDDVPGAPAPDASPPPGPAGKAPDDEPADEDAPPAGPAPQIDGHPLHADEPPDDAVTLLDALPGGDDAALAVVADDDRDATRPAPYAAQVLAAAAGSPTIAADLAYLEGYLGDNDGPRLLESLAVDPAFLAELDLARQDLEDVAAVNLVFAGSTVAVTTGLSVGYVVWLARGGVLLASMLSSMPAWRLVDPLPILASLASEDERGDGESLATLLEGADDADAQTPGDDDAE